MNNNDFTSMSIDELWELYEKLTAKLAYEVAVEKAKLEELLGKIESGEVTSRDPPQRDRASDLGRPRASWSSLPDFKIGGRAGSGDVGDCCLYARRRSRQRRSDRHRPPRTQGR